VADGRRRKRKKRRQSPPCSPDRPVQWTHRHHPLACAVQDGGDLRLEVRVEIAGVHAVLPEPRRNLWAVGPARRVNFILRHARTVSRKQKHCQDIKVSLCSSVMGTGLADRLLLCAHATEMHDTVREAQRHFFQQSLQELVQLWLRGVECILPKLGLNREALQRAAVRKEVWEGHAVGPVVSRHVQLQHHPNPTILGVRQQRIHILQRVHRVVRECTKCQVRERLGHERQRYCVCDVPAGIVRYYQ
jgi:hypothetical protein